jgi:hypothetical protein
VPLPLHRACQCWQAAQPLCCSSCVTTTCLGKVCPSCKCWLVGTIIIIRYLTVVPVARHHPLQAASPRRGCSATTSACSARCSLPSRSTSQRDTSARRRQGAAWLRCAGVPVCTLVYVCECVFHS